MRAIQTYILRLLVDSDIPERLRGSLQALSESQTRPFTNEQVLLDVLHTLVDENLCVGQVLSSQETESTVRQ